MELTNLAFGYIMHAPYEGLEGLKVWGWEVWPPEHYEALHKSPQSPTILHFPPRKVNLKNVSKNYLSLQTSPDGI